MVAPIRYRSPDEDSARWAGFGFRPGDIVVTTRSKSGTTWMQMLCALLIFRRPELPRPLAELSPWLDHLIEPIDQVTAGLDSQTHRRFIKTHTPLDGLPIRDEVTYITVARHPLDMAVSLYHQGANIDRRRLRELTGGASPSRSPEAPGLEPTRAVLSDWLRRWIDSESDPLRELDSLPGCSITWGRPGPAGTNRIWCWFTTTICWTTWWARWGSWPQTSV